MIIALDTETRGLNATQFLCGCIITERKPNKPMIFYKKEDMWMKILKLGISEAKRGKTLQVYAHNHEYDFYAYADLLDKNIKWLTTDPFILAYMNETGTGKRREIIKFLDTMSIYRMSLAKMAELNGMEKTETPEYLKKANKPNKTELKKTIPYIINDTKIVLQTILNLKKKLKNEGITIRRLYTINQIGINNLINMWRQKPENKDLFWDTKKGELHKTWPEKATKIHSAYRGGMVRAFQTGKFKEATTCDINSHYSNSSRKIRFPNLKTCKIKSNPTKDLLQKTGLSRALVYNKSCKIGFLPIRTPTNSYYPGIGKYLIGTWTNQELLLAEQEGYVILKLAWTITYETRPNNPFKEYMEELYHKRNESGTEHDKYFYKSMMNTCIGKLAQNKAETETIIDSVELVNEYLERNYKIIKGLDLEYAYQKELPLRPKPYYCPILPCLITAQARITLYNTLKQIKTEDLLYCDTDSITLLNYDKYKHLFNISNELGGWKIESHNEDCEIVSRKTYKIGNKVKISGIHHYEEINEDWKKGIIKNKKMVSIKTQTKDHTAGEFITEIRDLKKQNKLHKATQLLLEDVVIHLDHDITDITPFATYLSRIRNTNTFEEPISI